MEYTKTEWLGFEGVDFVLEDYPCKLIKPNGKPNGKWALKTEYFTAFPKEDYRLHYPQAHLTDLCAEHFIIL